MPLQTLVAIVENRAGILDRITGLLRRRCFEVRSLSLGETAEKNLRRMTLTLVDDTAGARRAGAHLAKLVDVVQVELLADDASVRRDLALFKVTYEPATVDRVKELCEQFRGRIIEASEGSAIVEITGPADKVDRFHALLEPVGVLEMACSGCVAMGRGAQRLGVSVRGEAAAKTVRPPMLISKHSAN